MNKKLENKDYMIRLRQAINIGVSTGRTTLS